MSSAKNLNVSELIVLKSLYYETLNSTGGEFGYVEDASRCGMAKSVFAGYVSQLKQKGMFDYHDTAGDFAGQFALTQEAIELVK